MKTMRLKLGESDNRRHVTNYIVEHPMIVNDYLVLAHGANVNPLNLSGAGCTRAKVGVINEEAKSITIWRHCKSVELEPLTLPIVGKVVCDISVGYTDNYSALVLRHWLNDDPGDATA